MAVKLVNAGKTANEVKMASQEFISLYSDTYKDAYGVRPHGIDFARVSDAELQYQIEALDAYIESEAYGKELDAEEERVSPLYNSDPLPYEEYDS